jgi:hypothetical protein
MAAAADHVCRASRLRLVVYSLAEHLPRLVLLQKLLPVSLWCLVPGCLAARPVLRPGKQRSLLSQQARVAAGQRCRCCQTLLPAGQQPAQTDSTHRKQTHTEWHLNACTNILLLL